MVYEAIQYFKNGEPVNYGSQYQMPLVSRPHQRGETAVDIQILTTLHSVGNILDCLLFLRRHTNCILLFKEISNKGRNGGTLSLGTIVKDSVQE
jgi:hypothetical protein